MSVDPHSFKVTATWGAITREASSTTPHNTQPLRFHALHGKGVRISRDDTAAKSVSSVENGVAFSARPVGIYEKVCFCLHEISDESCIYFGFMPYDPTALAHGLTLDTIRFMNKRGIRYRFLDPSSCKKDNILSYYFDSDRNVHFEINWCHKGVLSSRLLVHVKSSLWALIGLKNAALHFIDPEDTDTRSLLAEEVLPPPRYPDLLEPLSLHRTKGRNVQFVNEVAARIGAEFCQGYIFTALPMRLGQTIVVQILATEPLLGGSLSIGLTSCDPATLKPCDLPNNVTELLDRPEYWVVRQNAADGLRRGDEVAVTLTIDGEVQVSVNGSNTVTVMHVDCTVILWAFVDIYGATQKVRLFGTQARRAEIPTQQLRDVASSVASTSTDAGSFEAGASTSCLISGLKPTTDTSMSVDPRTSEATAAPQPTTGEASSTTFHNTQPLRFHAVHGESVHIFCDGTVASNVVSKGNGVAFSARRFRIYEKVCFRLHEISDESAIFFGFTLYDPTTLAHELKLDTIRFMNKPGNCYRFLDPSSCKKDNILSYYFDLDRNVHFEIDWCHKGVLSSRLLVDVKSSLWALVSVKYAALQFIDPEEPQQVRRCTQNPIEDEILVTDTPSLLAEEILPPPRYPDPLEPLSLHITKGKNVLFYNEVAERIGVEICQGYVFTALPMRVGQTIVVQILATEPSFMGSLAIGLTSCDPATLRPCDLPNNATELLDRPEYWVVRRNAADGLQKGDEVAVTLTIGGEVQIRVDGSQFNTVTVMHVDCTIRLWAFVDIYGATQKVRLLSTQVTRSETPPQQLRDVASSATLTPASACETVTSLPQIDAPNAANRQYIEPTQSTSQVSLNIDQSIIQSTSQHNPIIEEENPTNPECTLCFENPIDCVLYNCGHMCMCYSCGVKQWKETGNGRCPICRKVIRDIIRTYIS